MSEFLCTGAAVKDNVLEDLMRRVQAELPEELNRFVTFRQDEKTQNLIVDWSVELASGDLKLLTDLVVAYGGSFVNLKDATGKDRGCFMVPKSQPPPAVSSKINSEASMPSVDKSIKQQSPLSIHQDKYCCCCSDRATCTPRTSAGRDRIAICFEVMKLQYFDFVAQSLHNISQNQEASNQLLSVLLAAPLRPQLAVAENSSAVKPAMVPRDSRPTQGHLDLGIVWTNEVGGKGEYEKASEKDNLNHEAYFQLQDWIASHEEKPFKDGYFYWIFPEHTAIARKKTKQRGR